MNSRVLAPPLSVAFKLEKYAEKHTFEELTATDELEKSMNNA